MKKICVAVPCALHVENLNCKPAFIQFIGHQTKQFIIVFSMKRDFIGSCLAYVDFQFVCQSCVAAKSSFDAGSISAGTFLLDTASKT